MLPEAALIDVPPHLGYVALVGLVGLESSGLPVPGETALVAAALLAADGRLSIALVVGLAAAAAIVGDNLGYLLGRRLGRRVLTRPTGRYAARRARALDRGERFFARHGPKAVFLGRWVVGLRIWASWLAGMTHMPWRSFLVWNALGGIAWATTIGLAAYALGAAATRVFTTGAPALGAAAVIVLGAGWLVHRRRVAADEAPPPPPGP